MKHTGEKPYKCDECEYATAESSDLTKHIRVQHESTYIARRKVQGERVRRALVDAKYEEWFHPEWMPPIGYFKREKHVDFSCVDSNDTWCYIDFVIGCKDGFIFLEVDENQHRFGYQNDMLSCDMKRMNKVMTSLTLEFEESVPNIYWLRYNPDAFRIDDALQAIPRKEREAWLVAFLSELDIERRLTIGYAFYDSTTNTLDVLRHYDYCAVWKSIALNVTFELKC